MTAVRTLPNAATAGVTSETVAITPAMAEKWLGKNTSNRRVRRMHVADLAGQMTRGEWLMTGEAIKFSVSGNLLDGQHRLLAIVLSGKTIRMWVLRGLADEVQDVLDTNIRRSAADQAYIRGYENSSSLTAAAKIAILWESDRFYVDNRDKQVSHREILDFIEGNSMLAFAVSRSSAVARGCDLRPAVVACCFYELMKIDDQAALEFFERLADGVNLPQRSPILALRARTQNLRREHAILPTEALVALVFRTWNAWRTNRTIATLPIYDHGNYITCPDPR